MRRNLSTILLRTRKQGEAGERKQERPWGLPDRGNNHRSKTAKAITTILRQPPMPRCENVDLRVLDTT